MGTGAIPTNPIAPQMAPMPANWQQIARQNLMTANPPDIRPGDISRYMNARMQGFSHRDAMTLVHRARAQDSDPIGVAPKANLYGPEPHLTPTEAPWRAPQPKPGLSQYLSANAAPMLTPTASGAPSLAASPAEGQALAAMGQTAPPSAGVVAPSAPAGAAAASTGAAGPSGAPAAAKPSLSAWVNRKPLRYSEWLKQSPGALTPMALPAQPNLKTRLAQGVAAGLAGWGRPLAGVEALKAERAPLAQRTQMAEAYNAKLPETNLAAEREGYNQYLQRERIGATEQNAAADRNLRQQMLVLEEQRLRQEGARPGAQPRGQWATDAATGEPTWVTPEQLQANPRAYGPYNKPTAADGRPIAGTVNGRPVYAVYEPGKGFVDPETGQPMRGFLPPNQGHGFGSAYAAARLLDMAYRYDPRLVPTALHAVDTAMGHNMALPSGQAPGQPQDASGRPIGLAMPAAPTAQTRNRGQMAQDVLARLPVIRQEIGALQAQGELGPAMGRWNDFWRGKIGAGNPGFTRLRANLTALTSAFAKAHLNTEKGLEEFNGLANAGKMDAKTLNAALDSLQGWARLYAAAGEGKPPKVPDRTPAPAAPVARPPAGMPAGSKLMELRGERRWVAPGSVQLMVSRGARIVQ